MSGTNLKTAVAQALCVEFYGTHWDDTSGFRRSICYGMAGAALSSVVAWAGLDAERLTACAQAHSIGHPDDARARALLQALAEDTKCPTT